MIQRNYVNVPLTSEKQTGGRLNRKCTYVIQKSQIIGPDGSQATFDKSDMGTKNQQRRQPHRTLKKSSNSGVCVKATSL